MAEKNDQADDAIQKQKDVEYFSALVTAWLNTRLEKDKSLLALSAGAIGLLVTFLTAIGPNSKVEVALYLFAFIFYLVTISCVLWVFQRNSQHIEQVLTHNEKSDRLLTVLDYTIVYSFILGIVFTMAIGVIASINKIEKGDRHMGSEPKKDAALERMDNSLSGIGKLKPVEQQPIQKTDTSKRTKK